MWTLDPDDRTELINKRGASMLGHEPEDMIGHSPIDLLLPGEVDNWRRHLDEVKNGSTERFVHQVNRKDGSLACISVTMQPWFDDGRYLGSMVTLTDITERKKAEETLRSVKESPENSVQEPTNELAEREAGYRALFSSIDEVESLIDVIFDEDEKPVDMYYVLSNPAAKRMTGLDFTGKRLRDIAPYEEYWYDIFGRVAKTGESVRLERYAEPDRKWYSFYVFKTAGGNGRRVGNIFQDITERKRAEEALQEGEALYRTLFENTEDGFVLVEPIFDREGNSDDYHMLRVNEAWERQTGLRAAELVGRRIREAMPEVESSWPSTFAEVARTGMAKRFENYNEDSGRWYDLYAFQYKTGQVGVLFRDITERRMVEEALKESEARYRMILDHSSDAVWVMDRDGIFTYVSPSWKRLTGHDPEDLVGRTFEDIVHPDDLPLCIASLEEFFASEEATAGPQYRVLTADGAWRWHENSSSPMVDEEGKIVARVGISRDITERRRAEDMAYQYSQRLKRSNAELQQFAYVASHDLQEPLRMVTNYLSLVETRHGDELGPRVKEYVDIASRSAEQMRQLVKDLLQYSRVDTQGREFTSVDMNMVATTAMNELEAAIMDAHAAVAIDPLPTVWGDELQLKQVMSNLIGNAVKFNDKTRPKIQVSAFKYGSDIVFAVQDDGIGIDPKFNDKLFHMFSRLHSRDEYPGTGIGLAVSKKIVERHGGRIWVESEPGVGSTFYFTLRNNNGQR